MVLRTIDEKWRNHLLGMDQLREGIALKPNGQLFLIEYKGEDSKVPIKKIHKMTEKQAVKGVYHAQISENARPKETSPLQKNIQLTHANPKDNPLPKSKNAPNINVEDKVGRNDKIKVLSPSGEEVEIKFKKLESYLLKRVLLSDKKNKLHFSTKSILFWGHN